jgi:hypothetical protein
MGSVSPAQPQITPQSHHRLRMIVFVLIAVPVLLWTRFHFANLRVANDPSSQPDLVAATEQARPLVDALEKYHADNGLYPVTLDQLSPAYLASAQNFRAFRYSARHSDWVLQSDACIAREKSLNGWVLQEVKAYQKEVAQFKQECLNGYRDYQLQSADFALDAQSRYIERWAYYDSQPQHWSLGWCEHVPASRGKTSELATNGICRGRHRGANDSVIDP